jgi:hypothetical protein
MTDQVLERFWDKVLVDSNDCWNFYSMVRNGYGRFKINNKTLSAHRFAYEVNNGKIPYGLTLDHKCRNTQCVNPNHLEPVSQKVNVLRGNAPSARAKRTNFCIRGHPLFGDNLRINKTNNTRGCKACRKITGKIYSQKNKERLYELRKIWKEKNKLKLKEYFKEYDKKRPPRIRK